MRTLRSGNAWQPMVGALVGVAWLTLAIWEQSPYGRYLDHGGWTDPGLASSLCRALPGGPLMLSALLYVTGWLLMTIAMMVPTVAPLLAIFARITQDRTDRGILITLLILGYLSIWLAFGMVAHLTDMGLHSIVDHAAFLSANSWIVGATVLGVAGTFQFSKLKYRCLDKCRTPFSFLNEYWRGTAVRRQSYMLGVHHGLFCVGCCWAIMFLLFLVGMGNVGWMLVIGSVMAIEKNAAWGRWLSAPLGIGLLLASVVVLALNFRV
jgi:predicted metal-binding membrane protein